MQPNESEGLDKLTLPAVFASLEQFQAFVQKRAETGNVPPATRLKIELTLEEMLLNVFSYAYLLPSGSGQDQENGGGLVSVECGPAGSNGFLVRIRDQGRPFDPLSQPPPDVALSLDERKVGGLGILLVRQMTSSQSYRREGRDNVLEVVFGE